MPEEIGTFLCKYMILKERDVFEGMDRVKIVWFFRWHSTSVDSFTLGIYTLSRKRFRSLSVYDSLSVSNEKFFNPKRKLLIFFSKVINVFLLTLGSSPSRNRSGLELFDVTLVLKFVSYKFLLAKLCNLRIM